MELKAPRMRIMHHFLSICLHFYRKKICSNVKIEIKHPERGPVSIFSSRIRHGVSGLSRVLKHANSANKGYFTKLDEIASPLASIGFQIIAANRVILERVHVKKTCCKCDTG